MHPDAREVAADQLADRPGSWPVVASEQVWQGSWIVALREDRVHRPDHVDDAHTRVVLEHPGAVVVLAVDDRERVACLRQYRHAGPGWFVELPAGVLDSDEPPLQTAQRELREEVELAATDWRPLATLRPSVGITAETQHLFLARGLSYADRGDFELHAEEADMEVFWAPVEDMVEAVLDGRLTTSALVTAVLAYDALRRRDRA